MQIDNLIYKEADQEHFKGVISLWKENTEWGEITEEQLKGWLNAPYSQALLLVIVDNNDKVLGQCIVSPTVFNTPRGDVKAARISAPIVSNDLRGSNLLDPDHPINKLFRFAFEQSIKHNIDLVYMYPFASWVRVLQIAHHYGFPHFSIRKFKLYKTSVLENDIDTSFKVKQCRTVTDEHEKIWKKYQDKNKEFAIDRSKNWLEYKGGDFLKFEIFEKEELIGFVIYDQRKNLIYDLIAVSKEKHEQIGLAVTNYLLNNRLTKNDVIKFLGTDTLLSAMRGTIFQPLDFEHVFAAASLGSAYSFDDLEQKSWYLTSLE